MAAHDTGFCVLLPTSSTKCCPVMKCQVCQKLVTTESCIGWPVADATKKSLYGYCAECCEIISQPSGDHALYLYSVDNPINGKNVLKFGITKRKLPLREKEHERNYGEMTFVFCVVGITRKVAKDAEKLLKKYLDKIRKRPIMKVGCQERTELTTLKSQTMEKRMLEAVALVIERCHTK